MATWQFGLSLISQSGAASQGLAAGARLTDAQREELLQLGTYRFSAEAVAQLRRVLMPGRSWSESLEVLGNLESTCVTLLKEHDIVTEVGARLDLRTISPEILEAVLDFAVTAECLLMTDDNKLINPSLPDLKAEIRSSPAYRFVKDPRGFISDIAKEE